MSNKYELTKLSKVLIVLAVLGGIGDYGYNHFFSHKHTEELTVGFDNVPNDVLMKNNITP